jgi:GntR family transcriptional regulator/MocR family aminotransferase
LSKIGQSTCLTNRPNRTILVRRTSPVTRVLIELDRDAPEGLTAQVYAALRRAVLAGQLAPGARLPGSRSLARELSVSRATTVLAYEQLAAEGLVASKRGAGTFVTSHAGRAPPARVAPSVSWSLSCRGAAIASMPPPALRGDGPAVPFRLGAPALDRFPVARWFELARRRQQSVRAGELDYGEIKGLRALREAIAAHLLAARGTRCTPDEVLVVAGAQRGMELLFQTLLDPGDEVWMEEPGYTGAKSALRLAGARAVPVPVDDEGIDVAAGIARAPGARLAFVTPSHQFPAAVTLSERRRHALLDWAKKNEAFVVEDDYDSEFAYGATPLPCLHGLDRHGRVAYLGTFSKSIFPALRLGFIVAPATYCERMKLARFASDVQPPFIDQATLADFIAGGHFDRHLRRMRALYTERLEALSLAAAKYCGAELEVRPVRAGMHAIGLLRVSAEKVAHSAAARGIEVMPLSFYYSSKTPTLNGLVLGFSACGPESNARAMARLAACIEAARRTE